jgi:DNA-directed RNA polymerase specialized sigma subunit
MGKELTKEEVWIRQELTKLYPQLQINERKVLGAGYQLYGGDLLAVAIEFFLNKPIDNQVEAFNQGTAENYITWIMNIQAKSTTTKFYAEYKRHTIRMREYYPDNYLYDQQKVEDNSDDDLMVCLKQAIKQLDPYEKMLVEERIINGAGYDEIVEKYDIPYSSLSNELTKLKKKLKTLCKHYR